MKGGLLISILGGIVTMLIAFVFVARRRKP
jgi:hypothetical protein